MDQREVVLRSQCRPSCRSVNLAVTVLLCISAVACDPAPPLNKEAVASDAGRDAERRDVGRDAFPPDLPTSRDGREVDGWAQPDVCSVREPPTAIEVLVPGNLPDGAGDVPDSLDPQTCDSGRWFTWLPFGSAWIAVRPSDGVCEVWLGGETENPAYDGRATQYCRFPRRAACAVAIAYNGGGPARVISPGCFP